MILYNMGARLFRLGTLLAFCGILATQSSNAQCDFINDITGISLTTPPSAGASNPAFYTQTYVLVDNFGTVYATSTTPDFSSVPAGNYYMYAINYDNNESAAVTALLDTGDPWEAVENYGDDNINNCLDYTSAYGAGGCPIVVCEQMTVCRYELVTLTANNFQAGDFSQTYALVYQDLVTSIDDNGQFDFQAENVVPGNSLQIYGINYRTADGRPVNVGDSWSGVAAAATCSGSICFDYIGMDCQLNDISQTSGSGISTTEDFWDNSDLCEGATSAVNGGSSFTTDIDNTCVPSYEVGGDIIEARPGEVDDLTLLMSGEDFQTGISRFACDGSMDLSQNTVMYTVECATGGPSLLEVDVVANVSGTGINMIEAALYGPVVPGCPSFVGGAFVDCDDSGAGSISGEALSDLRLTTNGNPGEVFLVIVDTDGVGVLNVSSTPILLGELLVSFDGEKMDDKNLLEWRINEDENVASFDVERSDDGIYFDLFASVEASNNTTYNTVDAYPGLGTKYYRLKMYKADGSHQYSKIIALDREATNQFSSVSIYPNPTKGQFFVDFEVEATSAVSYQVLDVVGRVVAQGETQAIAGPNQIALDLGDMPAACYMVSMTINEQRINRKIIKH